MSLSFDDYGGSGAVVMRSSGLAQSISEILVS